MPSSLNTPLAQVEWGEFQDFIESKIQPIREAFVSTYSGKEFDLGGLLTNTNNHVQRLRELLTLRGANQPPIDTDLIEAMQPFQRLLMEYQLKTDINGDGKIYNWDYVYLNPQPVLSSLEGEPGAERIPGEMPPNGEYNGYRITGSVSGTTKEDVTITTSGEYEVTTETNVDGDFVLYLTNGSFTLTPSKSGFSFAPASINITVAGSDISNNDFVAS